MRKETWGGKFGRNYAIVVNSVIVKSNYVDLPKIASLLVKLVTLIMVLLRLLGLLLLEMPKFFWRELIVKGYRSRFI